MSHCPPIDEDAWPGELADMRQGFAGGLNVYRVMAHHPELLRAWAPLRQHVVKDSTLGPERSEVVILRTAHRFGSAYEWAHHVSRARAIGFSDDRIRAIADVPQDQDQLIVRGVDALLDDRRIPPALENDLADALGQRAVFDLIATVGFYSVLGYLLNTYETPVDDHVARELSRKPL